MASAKKRIVTRKPGTEMRIVSLAGMGRLLDVEMIQNHGIDTRNFVVFLGGIPILYDDATSVDHGEPGVEYQMSARFIKSLHILSRISPKRPILVMMQTCGGDWDHGMAIYDAVRLCTNSITILCYTPARSMSSIILQAADKRVFMPSSHFMFHQGTWGMESTYKQVKSNMEFDAQIREPMMLDIYAKAMARKFVGNESKADPDVLRKALFMMLENRVPEEELKPYARMLLRLHGSNPQKLFSRVVQICMDTKEDVFLTAPKAVEWGFADRVLEEDATGKVDWSSLLKYP